jgi:uncharacterized protein YoxC
MESKNITVIIVSILLGGLLGTATSYIYYSPKIDELDSQTQWISTEITDIDSRLKTIQNSVNEISNLNQLSSQVESLDDAINELSDRLINLENSIDQITYSETETPDWHYVTFIDENNDTIKPFYLSGNEVRLRWSYSADTSEAGVIFQIYYENGTLHSFRSAYGMWSADASDINLHEPGYYYIIPNYTGLEDYWLVIWDYY